MFNSHGVNSCILTSWKVKMLWLQKSLMYQSLMDIFFIKSFLSRVLKQILIKILHHTVFNALPIQSIILFLIYSLFCRKQFVEFFFHFGHELLDLDALFLSVAVLLYNLW